MKLDASHAFRRLLISQLALTLVYPLLGESRGLNFLLGGFFLLALYGGISVTTRKPWALWTSLTLGLSFVGSYWIGAVTDMQEFGILSSVFGAVFFWFIAVVMMKHIFFYRSRVNLDLIYGTISAYLLIGTAFSEMYVALAMLDSGAFSGFDYTLGYGQAVQSLTYYSFVTLTTLGYGDITPLAHYVRVLAYVEAIAGQFYLTILVARLVGTYIAQTQNKTS